MSAQTSTASDASKHPTSYSAPVEAHVHPPFRKLPWTLAILLAGLAGWLAYTYPPMQWRINDPVLLNIGALSPASEQAKLKAVEDANQWKNTLLMFSMAGLGIGLVGLILNARNLGQRWPAAVTTLLSGVIGGALAGALGLLFRRYLDHDHPLPFVSAQMRPLFADGLVFALISILLLLPVSVLLLFQPLKSDRHKAFAVPMAGVLTGLFVPMASALLLSGYTSTNTFPPVGIDLTLMWFACMAILTAFIVAYHGHRPDKASTSVA